MGSQFQFREGTADASIFASVTIHNEYELPEQLPPNAMVVDIGAHIGSFSHAVLARGAHSVIAFEADPQNHAQAARNLAPYGDRVRLHHAAVWRSDQQTGWLSLCDCPDPSNTGWREVFGSSSGLKVPAVPFDDVIRDASDWGRQQIHVLKIDCEGSEFPILLTSRTLHLVDHIVGEFHEFNSANYSEPIPERARVGDYTRYTMDELKPVLERWGFQVRSKPFPNSRLGLFWADRSAPARETGKPHFLQRMHRLVKPTHTH